LIFGLSCIKDGVQASAAVFAEGVEAKRLQY
jgi:hypothetical protein